MTKTMIYECDGCKKEMDEFERIEFSINAFAYGMFAFPKLNAGVEKDYCPVCFKKVINSIYNEFPFFAEDALRQVENREAK